MTSLVAYSIIFKSLFATDGFVNAMLMNLHIIDAPIAWITTTGFARALIIIAITWRWTGYNMIFYLAGLQGIDDSVYEAAALSLIHIFEPSKQWAKVSARIELSYEKTALWFVYEGSGSIDFKAFALE